MPFDNLSNDKKREILNLSIKSSEHMLYESLLRLGLDPSSFDIDSFNIEDFNLNPSDEEFVKNLEKSIRSINLIKQEKIILGQ
jgi:hypothetical protein